MRRIGIGLLTLVCVFCGAGCSWGVPAQHRSVSVDWKAELDKARPGIHKDPKSAFWHNQAGVAYDALGDFAKFEELGWQVYDSNRQVDG